MPLLSTLTLSLGAIVAKTVFKIWLSDSQVASDVSSEIVDLVKSRIPDFATQRSVTQQFERLADEVAQKLLPYFEHEFRNLPENEQQATINAVASTISSIKLDDGLLFTVDLDPIQLERAITIDKKQEVYLLSTDAASLYEILLKESCNYIVEIAITLPAFSLHSTQEILRREREIIALVKQVLKNIQPRHVLSAKGHDIFSNFEHEYRNQIARKLDWLELYGLDVSSPYKRYALTVGYISLTATDTKREIAQTETKQNKPIDAPTEFDDANEIASAKESDSSESGSDSEAETLVRVEDALFERSRLLIRGEAGSGKTTLLQWLAVQSANQNFDGKLSEWNNCVPFFIQLRRYNEQPLPAPEEFLNHVAKNYVGVMPDGWVHHQLHLTTSTKIPILSLHYFTEPINFIGIFFHINKRYIHFDYLKYHSAIVPSANNSSTVKSRSDRYCSCE